MRQAAGQSTVRARSHHQLSAPSPLDPAQDRPAPVALDDVVERARKVAWQSVAGETVLVRGADQTALGLSEVASRLWDLLDGRRTVGQIVEAVCGDFEVPAETARADILRFLDDLASRRLVTVRGRKAPPDA